MALPDDAGRVIAITEKFREELNAKLAAWGIMTPPTPALDEDGEPLPNVQLVAKRKFTTVYSLEDLKSIHVDLMPITLEETLADRKKTTDRLYGINVIVQQQIVIEQAEPEEIDGVLVMAAATTEAIMAQIDALMKLTIAIFEAWPQETPIAGMESVTVAESAILLYSPELQENTHYYGVAGFIFQERR